MISGNRNRQFQMQCNRIHCKCNRNQRLLSRLYKYHAISCQRYGWYVSQKLPPNWFTIDGLLSYLYTWWFVSLFVLWTWKGNVLKHCFRWCRYWKSYKQAFQIKSCSMSALSTKCTTRYITCSNAQPTRNTDLGDQRSKYGGGRVIEEKFNLQHSNNLRLKKWPIYRSCQVTEGSELRVWLYSNYLIY